MADLLSTIANKGLHSEKDTKQLLKLYEDATLSQINLVEGLIAESRKLYADGKRSEANKILELVDAHIKNITEIHQVVVEVFKRAIK